MAYPTGIELCNVTVGSSLDFFGVPQATTVEVTAVLGGSSDRLIWAATGQVMVAGESTHKAAAGETISFDVPNPDQPGFLDGSGNDVRNWSYTATVLVGGKRWVQAFQPTAGQTVIDLDLVPEGQVSAPTSAPTQYVTSVNGEVGDVVIETGGGTGGGDGASAYEIAVANGFIGTESAWLDSLQGAPGSDATVTISNIPAGMVLFVRYDNTNDLWPARPTSRSDISVNWHGGLIQPTEMIDGDLWITASTPVDPEPEPDVEAPSIPTGLLSLAITETGFTLSWDASTDNTAVTGYEVLLDGVPNSLPTVNNTTISGLTPETVYQLTVRARDEAGNWSAPSAPLTVTTAAGGGAPTIDGAFSIVGTNEGGNYQSYLGGTVMPVQTDGPVILATAFYADAADWEAVGGSLWVPVEASAAVGSSATINIHVGNSAGLETPPLATATIASLALGANKIAFPATVPIPAGTAVWLSVTLSVGTWWRWDPTYTTAIKSADANVYQAGETNAWGTRSRWLYPGGGNSGTAKHIYGLDLLFKGAA